MIGPSLTFIMRFYNSLIELYWMLTFRLYHTLAQHLRAALIPDESKVVYLVVFSLYPIKMQQALPWTSAASYKVMKQGIKC